MQEPQFTRNQKLRSLRQSAFLVLGALRANMMSQQVRGDRKKKKRRKKKAGDSAQTFRRETVSMVFNFLKVNLFKRRHFMSYDSILIKLTS